MAFDWSGAISGAYKQVQGMSKNWMNNGNSGPMTGGIGGMVSRLTNRAGAAQQQTQENQTYGTNPVDTAGGGFIRKDVNKLTNKPKNNPNKPSYGPQGCGPVKGSNIRYRGA